MKVDIRDISIINEFPVLYKSNDVLTVGCGECRLEIALQEMGYNILATDIDREKEVSVPYQYMDIFKPNTFPKPRGVVVCSQVLEHLTDYKKAFANLMSLATERLIVTIPVGKSFSSPDHVNVWVDHVEAEYHYVGEFFKLAWPYSQSTRMIITKPADRDNHQYNFVITVDKNQLLSNEKQETL
jgi:hypothetical protein